MLLSIIVPLYNERENVKNLFESIRSSLSDFKIEIVLVDDGSNDGTPDEVMSYAGEDTVLVRFARNYGQTSAIAAGIEAASGDIIVTMDGDLQNDPSDIPLMIKKLERENLDVVAGRRKNRRDGMFLRKIPSMTANWLIRKTTKVKIHDYGCTLKVFRSDIAKKLDLYGELHRFIPLLGSIYGAKIAEMNVKHHPRKHGVSKYGIGRTFRVMSDLMLMLFFLKFRQKPMHLFGPAGLASLGIGGLIMLYLFAIKLTGEDIGNRPLLVLGMLMILAGLQLISTGFIAELNMRTYFESQSKKPYTVAEIIRGSKKQAAA